MIGSPNLVEYKMEKIDKKLFLLAYCHPWWSVAKRRILVQEVGMAPQTLERQYKRRSKPLIAGRNVGQRYVF